jgi:hypothetical protein
MSNVEEVAYVDECPTCGMRFIGMSPEEFRETHAVEDCPKKPLGELYVFPTNEYKQKHGY